MSATSYLRGLFGGDAARVAEALARELQTPVVASESFAQAGPGAKASDLLVEHGRPSIGSIINATRASVADSLTPARLGAILRDADNGNIESYLTLAEEMEEREPHYRSVIGTRKMAVSGAPLVVHSASDSAHDTAIMEHVEQVMAQPSTEGLVLDLMDAVSKSFSCVEIIWQRDSKTWEPIGYEHREQRHFLFDKDTMRTPLLRTMEHVEGSPLAPFKWLVHMPKLASGVPIRTGLARPVAICYSAKKYTLADWLAFLDVYGMPMRVGKFPASMVSKKAELLRAVRSMGSDAACVIPAEMSIELMDGKGSGSGNGIFQATAEYFDKQVSKVVLGQTMSSDDGASLAQSKTHERVRFDIKKADARAVAATINRDLIKPFVILNYGPQKVYPTVELQTEEPEDRKALIDTVKVFVGLGGKVQMSEIRDRLGLLEPEEGADLLTPDGVAAAALAPQPEPEVDGDDPDPEGDDPAEDDDDLGNDDAGNSAELNSSIAKLGERFTRLERTVVQAFDVIDEQSRLGLEDWRQLDGPVVDAMAAIEAAQSFAEAEAIIAKLKEDAGEQLDVEPLTRALSLRTFIVRGVGDATDDPEV